VATSGCPASTPSLPRTSGRPARLPEGGFADVLRPDVSVHHVKVRDAWFLV
jgi:hypothetical protein